MDIWIFYINFTSSFEIYVKLNGPVCTAQFLFYNIIINLNLNLSLTVVFAFHSVMDFILARIN